MKVTEQLTGSAPCFAFLGDLLLLKYDPEPSLLLASDLEGLSVSERSPGRLSDKRPGNRWASLDPDADIPHGMRLVSLRELWGVMGEGIFFDAGRAFQLMDWSRRNLYCGQCASKMTDILGETARECPECRNTSYPPVSPAIIVAVEKDGQLLLARNFRFPKGRYSILAGFVEPGETLESAVEREVLEEVSIRIKDIAYFGSQPWSFPHSLMVGFRALWAGGDIAVDGKEIEEAHWFTPDSLPDIPPSISISRQLIDDFIARNNKR